MFTSGSRRRDRRRTSAVLLLAVVVTHTAIACTSTDADGGARDGGHDAGTPSDSAAGGANDGAAGATGELGALGASCATTADCEAGLTCYTASSTEWGGMGPANGYCSLDCSADEAACLALDPTGVCYPFSSGKAFCIPGCSFGPATQTTFDPNKCHARQDAACTPVVTFPGGNKKVTPACFPRCNAGSDCNPNQHCDPQWGLCTAQAPTGKELGERCELGVTGECQGTCKPFLHPSGSIYATACSESCTRGAMPNCGFDGTKPADAYCYSTLAVIVEAGGPGVGDLGSCVELCDCNSDCASPDFVCRLWPADDAELGAVVGRKGRCAPPFAHDGGLDPGIVCP
jgi:hypothetical protein